METGLLKLEYREAIIYSQKKKLKSVAQKYYFDHWRLIHRIKNNSVTSPFFDKQFFKMVMNPVIQFDALILAGYEEHIIVCENFEQFLISNSAKPVPRIIGSITINRHKSENELLAKADALLQKISVENN